MKRGQGSTETLLILGVVLLLAAVVVLVASNMLSTPKAAGNVASDMSKCSLADADLVGYTTPYDGGADVSKTTAPTAVKSHGKEFARQTTLATDKQGDEVCKLGPYSLYYYQNADDPSERAYYLATGTTSQYWQYGEATGGGEERSVTVSLSGSNDDNNCGGSGTAAPVSRSTQGGPTKTATLTVKVSGDISDKTVTLHLDFGTSSTGTLQVTDGTTTVDYSKENDKAEIQGLLKTGDNSLTLQVKSGTDGAFSVCDDDSGTHKPTVE